MQIGMGMGIRMPQGRTLIQRAISILRKFGTDAHVYLPGVGMLNGLQAGNYIDSAGTTAATVDQPVGLVLDATGGIHATQPTTSNKPILRQTGGRYSWEFDGLNDSLSLGGPAFQMADDHCVVAGLNVQSSATSVIAAVSRSESGISNAALIYTASGGIHSIWRDAGDTAALNPPSIVSAIGVPCVASAVKRGSAKELRRNGVSGGINTKSPGSAEISTGSIGKNQYGNFFNGSIYPVITIKGTVSDADLLLLEKWVGSMSGVTI